jgi:hypothetical protein
VRNNVWLGPAREVESCFCFCAFICVYLSPISNNFWVIFPPPQRKYKKEFRDRTFDAQLVMLCSQKSRIERCCVQQSGGKILHFPLRSNGNEILAMDDGKTVRKSACLECPTKLQSKSGMVTKVSNRFQFEKQSVSVLQSFWVSCKMLQLEELAS